MSDKKELTPEQRKHKNAKQREYYKNNKNRIFGYQKEYKKQKLENDPEITRAKWRLRYKNLTLEQKKQYISKVTLYKKERMTTEQKERTRNYQKEYHKKYYLEHKEIYLQRSAKQTENKRKQKEINTKNGDKI